MKIGWRLLRSVWHIVFAFWMCGLASSPAWSFTIQDVTSPGGIKAWLVEEKAIPLLAISFSFRSGSASDPAGKEGLAEFLTGMLDEGAGPMLADEFQKQRDALAFRMSFEQGAETFQGNFQTLSRNRDEAVRLLRLAITEPRFDPEPLERVRKQFLLNIQEDLQDPQGIAWRNWAADILPGDPYSRPSGGTAASMSAISSENLHRAHQRIFTKDTLQIAVVGDITAAELGPLLDQIFGGLPEHGPDQAALPPARPAEGPKLAITDRDMPQSVIVFGHEGLLRSDPDFIPAYVMSEILGGGGLNSRLNAELREKRGLTYGVSFSLSPLPRVGLYVGVLQTKNESAGEALALTRSVIARYAEEGPTQAELEEAKTFLTGSFPLRFSSNAAIAGQLLALQQANLGIDYVATRNAKIDAVTLDQVRAQARRLLRPDRLIVSVVGRPKGLQ